MLNTWEKIVIKFYKLICKWFLSTDFFPLSLPATHRAAFLLFLCSRIRAVLNTLEVFICFFLLMSTDGGGLLRLVFILHYSSV